MPEFQIAPKSLHVLTRYKWDKTAAPTPYGVHYNVQQGAIWDSAIEFLYPINSTVHNAYKIFHIV